MGFAGATSPGGCLLYRTLSYWPWNLPQTRTNVLTAPTVAGVYDVIGAGELTYWCGQFWNGTGQTFAKIVVVSPDSLCALIESYSSDPDVAAGLCDKLVAWDKAMDRGNLKAADGIMGAFHYLLRAQTDKALTVDEVTMIQDLAAHL